MATLQPLETKSHLNIAAATAEGCKGTATVWFDTAQSWGPAGNLLMGCRTDTYKGGENKYMVKEIKFIYTKVSSFYVLQSSVSLSHLYPLCWG